MASWRGVRAQDGSRARRTDGAGAGQVGAASGLLLSGDRPKRFSWHLGYRNLRHVALSPCFHRSALLPRIGKLRGWLEPKLRRGTPEVAWPAIWVSSGLSLSPGLPHTRPLPRALPVVGWARLQGGVGVYLRFQVFPALGQPGSLTNQLLQAQGIGEGVLQEAARTASGCGCGRRQPSWSSLRGSLAHSCCSLLWH